MAALSISITVPPISDLHQHRSYAQFFPRIPQQFPVVSSHLIAQATRRTSNSHQESDALSNESRSWGRIEFDDDEDDEDDDEEEEDRSLDLLLRFIENVFRKVSRRARKAVRSVLPPAISTKLVGFSVNGAILLAFLWVLKAFLEVVCTLGSVVFVSILLIRGVWSAVMYLQENRNHLLNEIEDDHRAWPRAQPVT
ncbi:hypothetical protein Nepgr_004910 [Nepenthes gracilis]|uniref:Uncharacterized protein n=1 Tax=Nepenthes gracilis TaxID=150966 RepID=A0AAD3S272_NEPGR|nr:hypothetical protein Nepgr_004910 [Nepenthes gracilis]